MFFLGGVYSGKKVHFFRYFLFFWDFCCNFFPSKTPLRDLSKNIKIGHFFGKNGGSFFWELFRILDKKRPLFTRWPVLLKNFFRSRGVTTPLQNTSPRSIQNWRNQLLSRIIKKCALWELFSRKSRFLAILSCRAVPQGGEFFWIFCDKMGKKIIFTKLFWSATSEASKKRRDLHENDGILRLLTILVSLSSFWAVLMCGNFWQFWPFLAKMALHW